MMTDFWRTIGSNPARSGDDVRQALDRVSGRLDELDAAELVKFAENLREALYWIDKRVLAEIPVVLAGGLELTQTSDHFLYARCACILAGKDAYYATLTISSEFTRFVSPFSQAAEGILYLAPGIYEKKFGHEMEKIDRFPIESMSNVHGWSGGLTEEF